MHPAAIPEDELLESCQIQRTRRSGPGGQHRNKVETAIVITHIPTGIRGEASERRSQVQNRSRALQRLRVNLALEIRDAVGSSVPSALWVSRLRGRRISINPDHRDFPAILAEAMNVLAGCSSDVRLAANQLHVSPSQLLKLLKLEPRAMARVNQQRLAQGLHRL
jgi:hypothetical protein